jgi:molybdenum cofactor synthesis domain-containing protein
MRVAILTVSDSVVKGTREDLSGKTISDWCAARGYEVAEWASVTDETSEIAPLLCKWCDSSGVDLVLTTGGTGLSPRDVTPEATLAVIQREAPGISELLRTSSFEKFPRAALSRGAAGVRGSSLIVNLPGSPGGVKDSLSVFESIVEHAVDVVRGKTSHDEARA